MNRAVLVIGGGIAGMQAALDLAAMDHPVYLLERGPSIGGNMARLDKTFPTNDCSTCMIAPRMVSCARTDSIHLLTLAELVDLEGEPGDFRARIRRLPRYVDEEACISCGLCVDKCPRKAADEYNAGLASRKAIYFLYPQAIPLVPLIDTDACIYFQKGRCRACEKLCPRQAVRLDQQPWEEELAVGAVIVAGGYDLALVPQAGEFGHRRYPNVVTNLEYERMLAATGPYQGHPLRPSDSTPPRRVAWIQCVASRDSARNRNFCSSVCCMAAVKQAILTREHEPDSEAVIFYMDIRAQGKDFDRYVLRARDSYNVEFVRSMLSQIIHDPRSGNLLVEYYDRDTLEHRSREFDLVVLSAGMQPAPYLEPALRIMGLQRNRYGFVVSDPEEPTHTSRPGIFACGAIDGPKDIPESVAAASAAAASAAILLSPARSGRKPATAATPAMAAASPARIGVLVCHCGRNIASVLPVADLRSFAASLEGVIVARDFTFTCATQTQEEITALIHEHQLNRIVVAACSPRTHEPLFQETLSRAGLNKYLFEMANIRDQCAWVHGDDRETARLKAEDLIRAAVARARLLEPVAETVTPVMPAALVIGGGIAGMTAALSLADQGLDAVLVEVEAELGGMARRIHHTLEGNSPRRLAAHLAARAKSHRHITLHTGSQVTAITGGIGNYTARVRKGGEEIEVECGAVIVATGGQPYEPEEYLRGRDPRVLTQLELEEQLFAGTLPPPATTAMIQCIGSRTEDFPQCSRLCCSAAVKNAIKLKEVHPEGAVFVFYRDIRTFGFKEEYYKRARDLGVIFVKFDQEQPPRLWQENGSLHLHGFDPASGYVLELEPDLVVLSTGIRPRPQAEAVAAMLKLPVNQEGFFIEDHPKLRPLDFSTSGVFLCGLAHSPRFVEETMAQARGAAARAAAVLLQEAITTSGVVAVVDRERCTACLVCVNTCPYHVPVVDEEGSSTIDPRGCQGCGVCVAECPAGAITLAHYTDTQLWAQIRGVCAQGASPPTHTVSEDYADERGGSQDHH